MGTGHREGVVCGAGRQEAEGQLVPRLGLGSHPQGHCQDRDRKITWSRLSRMVDSKYIEVEVVLQKDNVPQNSNTGFQQVFCKIEVCAT